MPYGKTPENVTDFSRITPCGENCEGCEHKISGEGKGCLETEGKCVKMWDKECYVFQCCKRHNVPFCGLCANFPCGWLIEKQPVPGYRFPSAKFSKNIQRKDKER